MKRIIACLFTFLVTASMAFAQGNNGLIAHWGFNGNANDVGPNNLNGTINGTVTPDAGYNGKPNTAMRFSTNAGGIDVGSSAILQPDAFSLCALVKATAFTQQRCQGSWIAGTNGSNNYAMAFCDNSYDNVTYPSQDKCAIFSPNQQRLTVVNHGGSPTDAQYLTQPAINANQWYCVAMTYAHDTLKLYTDGVLYLNAYLPNNYSLYQNLLTIGYVGTVGSSNGGQFIGLIDDMRLYGRALSATEVGMYCDSAKLDTKGPYCDTLIIRDTLIVHDTIYLTTGIPNIQQEQHEIMVVPNPAHNYINVFFADDNAAGTAQLIDALGRVVKEQPILGQAANFDINNLSPGSYILKAEVNGQTITRKILKN